jgi:hypothetical protein
MRANDAFAPRRERKKDSFAGETRSPGSFTRACAHVFANAPYLPGVKTREHLSLPGKRYYTPGAPRKDRLSHGQNFTQKIKKIKETNYAYQLPSLARRRGDVSLGNDRFTGDGNFRRHGGGHG